MTLLKFYFIDFNVSIILNCQWFHCKILMCVLHWVMRPFNSRVCVLICNVISISLFAKRKNILLMLNYFHNYDDNDYLVLHKFSVAIFCLCNCWMTYVIIIRLQSGVKSIVKICLVFHAQIMDIYCCSPISILNAKILIHSYSNVSLRTLYRNNHLYADA